MEEVLPRSSPVDAVPMDPLLTKYDLLFFGQKLGNMPNWLCPFATASMAQSALLACLSRIFGVAQPLHFVQANVSGPQCNR